MEYVKMATSFIWTTKNLKTVAPQTSISNKKLLKFNKFDTLIRFGFWKELIDLLRFHLSI